MVTVIHDSFAVLEQPEINEKSEANKTVEKIILGFGCLEK
jgi:hypothetical protein